MVQDFVIVYGCGLMSGSKLGTKSRIRLRERAQSGASGSLGAFWPQGCKIWVSTLSCQSRNPKAHALSLIRGVLPWLADALG